MGYTKKSDVYPIQSSSAQKTDPVCKFSGFAPKSPRSVLLFLLGTGLHNFILLILECSEGHRSTTHLIPNLSRCDKKSPNVTTLGGLDDSRLPSYDENSSITVSFSPFRSSAFFERKVVVSNLIMNYRNNPSLKWRKMLLLRKGSRTL